PFTMQMTLIIVLGSTLSASPAVRRIVIAVSRLPQSPNGVVSCAILLAAAVSYLHWGLGYSLAPVIAVYFAREAEKKGISMDFPFLLASTYAGVSVWQFGLSASAPLLVATPGHFLESSIGIVPLRNTIWSPATLFHIVAFTASAIVLARWAMPRERASISQFPESYALTESHEPPVEPTVALSSRVERHPMMMLALCAVLGAWLFQHFIVNRSSLDINSLNTTLLMLTLLLHGNFKSFTDAIQKAVVSSWPVIILYHLYAGVAGLIQFTPVGETIAALAAAISTPYTFPVLTTLAGTLVSVFVPSSGGQWAIQGFVTSKAAIAAGVSVERGLLALSVGDQMGNLMTPFWYVVVAGIARLNFRRFFGYGLIYAALWFVIGVFAFTFLPC
ncbi:MAG TPA: TIGR00366 family protein, partial [Terriglobia bacterium]|nr:TIGR00366 family protein [Terriglobia bacterium]